MPTKKKVTKQSTTKKKTSKKPATKKVVKKKPVKKAVSKKKPVAKKKKTTKKKSMAAEAALAPVTMIAIDDVDQPEPETPEPPSVPPMEPMPQDEPKDDGHLESSSEGGSCTTCRHMPVSVNAVVGVLSILALALSIAVITSLLTIESQDYQIRAFNAGGAYLEEVARR